MPAYLTSKACFILLVNANKYFFLQVVTWNIIL